MTPVDNGGQAPAWQVLRVAVGIRPCARVTLVLAGWRDVEEMPITGGAHEDVAALIPIHTAHIGRAVRKDLELFRYGMKSSEAALDCHSVVIGIDRICDFARRVRVVGHVQPAIWSPREVVE